MKTLLAAVLFLGICIVGMCFNVIFRKNGEFPKTEISENEDMRKMGIKCMRELDDEIHGSGIRKERSASCSGEFSDSCKGCGFYNIEKQRQK